MKAVKRSDVMRKMCNIQRELDDTVVFTVGIRENGKIIDIINIENTLQSRKKQEPKQEIEFQLPDYIG